MQKEFNLLVTGLVRDSSRHLKNEIARIEKHAEKLFSQVNFFLVESDSADQTTNSLSQLKILKSNFDFISLGNLTGIYPNRLDRLRYCRNEYVNKIREDDRYRNCDFVLVVDFDIKNRSLNLDEVGELLHSEVWEGIFANQRGPYYDIFALRCIGWVEEDCFKKYNKLSENMSRAKAKHIAIWSQMRRIPTNASLIEVQSAFGGMGLYRRECFDRFDYSAPNFELRSESEHISLHYKITNGGGKLFILPAMTNFSFAPHNLSAYRIFRLLDKISRPRIFKQIRLMLRQLLP